MTKDRILGITASGSLIMTVSTMIKLDPKRQYYIGFWASEGGGRALCASDNYTLCVWESEKEAKLVAFAMKTPLQIVAVSGEKLLEAGQPLLLKSVAKPVGIERVFMGGEPLTL